MFFSGDATAAAHTVVAPVIHAEAAPGTAVHERVPAAVVCATAPVLPRTMDEALLCDQEHSVSYWMMHYLWEQVFIVMFIEENQHVNTVVCLLLNCCEENWDQCEKGVQLFHSFIDNKLDCWNLPIPYEYPPTIVV